MVRLPRTLGGDSIVLNSFFRQLLECIRSKLQEQNVKDSEVFRLA